MVPYGFLKNGRWGLCLNPNLSPRLAPGQCAGSGSGSGSGLNRGQAPSALSEGVALLVAGMNGEVVALDARLHEIHRFRAYVESAVNVLQCYGRQDLDRGWGQLSARLVLA